MRITEVYPYQPGATADYQLRGGTGHHDSFVELYTSEPTSLAGYRIRVGDCEIVCPRDSYIWNFKAIWLSDMAAVSGGRCKQFPTSGIVNLYDPQGTLIDTRGYTQSRVGESWAPLDALDPDSSWDSRVPSPGRNHREGDQIPVQQGSIGLDDDIDPFGRQEPEQRLDLPIQERFAAGQLDALETQCPGLGDRFYQNLRGEFVVGVPDGTG